jgi:hypothetical protein
MEFSEIYHRHMSMNIPMNEFCTVGLGIPPVPRYEILPPVDLINVKLCTYSICFCIIFFFSKKRKKCSFAQHIKVLIQMNRIVNFKGNVAKRHACASSNICRMPHPMTVCSLASDQKNPHLSHSIFRGRVIKLSDDHVTWCTH